LIKACTDLSDGGLALAAVEMASGSGVGVVIDETDQAKLFGEDQGRYLVACNFDQAEALFVAAGQASVPITTVGRFTGDTVKLGGSDAALAELKALHAGAFAGHFA
jgi:phosphoribosylformylglycinamidine synthase